MRILLIILCFYSSVAYGASVRTSTLTFQMLGKPIQMSVFSPRRLPAKRLPTIIMSHGWAANDRSQQGLAHDLVKAGFIVGAVHHNTDVKRIGRPGFLVLRPLELRASLDHLLASRFAKHIDAKRIGAFGYSMGGYTVLAAAGGQYDPNAKARHCAKNKADRMYCSGEKDSRPFDFWVRAQQRFYTMPKVNMRQSLRDKRIRAIALAAPVGVPFSSLNKVRMPVLLMRGEKDAILRFPYHAEAIHRALPKRHIYKTYKGLSHLDFLSLSRNSGRRAPLKTIHRDVIQFFRQAL